MLGFLRFFLPKKMKMVLNWGLEFYNYETREQVKIAQAYYDAKTKKASDAELQKLSLLYFSIFVPKSDTITKAKTNTEETNFDEQKKIPPPPPIIATRNNI